jgi:hypothetical protein
VLVAAGLLAAGCRDAGIGPRHAAVLGASRTQAETATAPPVLTDIHGNAIPAPPAPGGSRPQMARWGDESALAVWVQDGHVVAAAWTRGTGWSSPEPLERIYGQSSEPRLASNGKGVAMVVWQHTVGNIHSLRFSRFESASAWSPPDVLPGALPRPVAAGAAPGQNALRLQVDADGNAEAHWPSGFHANGMQMARYVTGQGWSQAATEPVASASASPASNALPVASAPR